VAHSLSAKKRVRQNLKRRARNRARKTAVREVVKAFAGVLAGTDVAKAETEFRKVSQKLDRTAAKGTIHKKTAARKRSRLAKKLNVMKAKAAGGGGTPAAKKA
jgi:small subunit ribosomal protein S20